MKPFYGWIIVAVSFLVGFAESGVFQNILSIFMKPMVAEFGWSRASVTGAMAVGSIGGGFLSLVVGPLLDRYGPKMVTFWGVLILSLGLGALMFVTDIWQFYLFFGVGRMIAVGVLSLAISISVANWFVRFRGRAMGITRMGDRLGSALLPILVQFLILALGWRMAWFALGVLIFAIAGLPALLFLRRRPEDMGLHPDGIAPALPSGETGNSSTNGQATVEAEPSWTRSQALGTKTFWMLTLLDGLIPFVQAGINFHIYPFLTDHGFSEATAVLILATIAIFGIPGAALWGMLTERFRLPGLLAANVIGSGLVFLALYRVALSGFAHSWGIGLIFFLAALHGILHGGRNPMFPVIWANFFGRRSLGSIYSLANPFHFTTNAVGPVFAGLCFDWFGSYVIPFNLFVILFFLSGVISFRLRPPNLQKPRDNETVGLHDLSKAR